MAAPRRGARGSLDWSALTFCTLRLVCTGDQRLWLVGAFTGVGLMNKLNIAFLAVALVLSIAASPEQVLLRSIYCPAGAALAGVLFMPDIVWNATHGWAQIAMLATCTKRALGSAPAWRSHRPSLSRSEFHRRSFGFPVALPLASPSHPPFRRCLPHAGCVVHSDRPEALVPRRDVLRALWCRRRFR